MSYCEGAIKAEAELRHIGVVGVRGDPLKSEQVRRRLDVTAYKCAIILCDQSWLDPDLDLANGVALKSQSDMLRLDAMVMTVQLNIRKLLEAAGFPDINIVCEKVAFEGVTRFEDRQRLPMGICVNLTAYAAKLCFQVAYNPMILAPYSAFGETTELKVQDASAFAANDEHLSFWEMQARCLAVGQTLMGYYQIPTTVDRPLDLAVNPWGDAERTRKVVWNAGDNRRKLITLAHKATKQENSRYFGMLKAGGGIPVGAQWADGSGNHISSGSAGKKEVGRIVLAHGGRLRGAPREKDEKELVWVSDRADGEKRSNRQLKKAASVLRGQETWDFGNKDSSHMLDELASKQDHSAAG